MLFFCVLASHGRSSSLVSSDEEKYEVCERFNLQISRPENRCLRESSSCVAGYVSVSRPGRRCLRRLAHLRPGRISSVEEAYNKQLVGMDLMRRCDIIPATRANNTA